MRRTVELGTLARGRVFFRKNDGSKWQVVKNLGVAGVSVRPAAGREVTIGDRTFTRPAQTQVWTASAPVEVEPRQAKVAG